MPYDTKKQPPPRTDETQQPVARRMVSDDGVSWRPYDYSDGRRARFERVEITTGADLTLQ